MEKKEKKAGVILIIGFIIFILIFVIPVHFIDLNSKNGIYLLLLFFGYLVLSFWIGSLENKTTNRFLKWLIYIFTAPMAVIYFVLKFGLPFMTVILNFILYLILSFVPVLFIGFLNKTKIILISHEEFIFWSLTIATIISVTCNKYILKFIIKHSPAFTNNRHGKDTIELKELTKYIFNPNNIRFLIYFLYFIFMLFFSVAYLRGESVYSNKLLDNSILQAFLVFLAYDSIRINSKDLKLLPSKILSKFLRVFTYDETKNVEKQESENLNNEDKFK